VPGGEAIVVDAGGEGDEVEHGAGEAAEGCGVLL
jgi:hypothetical protein